MQRLHGAGIHKQRPNHNKVRHIQFRCNNHGDSDAAQGLSIIPEFFFLILQELEYWRDRLENSSLAYTAPEIYYQQIRRCIEIGLACVKFDRSKRPTTGQIINMLRELESAHFGSSEEVKSLTNE
ncbi:hypothetical protein U9M48_003767, partial [Paspalum notatum var. saurae]